MRLGWYEVDFIIEYGNSCIAVEVKSSSKIQQNDFDSLKKFKEITPSCISGVLAYNGTQVLRLDKNIYAIPIRLFLS